MQSKIRRSFVGVAVLAAIMSSVSCSNAGQQDEAPPSLPGSALMGMLNDDVLSSAKASATVIDVQSAIVGLTLAQVREKLGVGLPESGPNGGRSPAISAEEPLLFEIPRSSTSKVELDKESPDTLIVTALGIADGNRLVLGVSRKAETTSAKARENYSTNQWNLMKEAKVGATSKIAGKGSL